MATPRASAAAAAAAERLALPLSVLLLSAAALGYQLLLMRLLAIVHWYPFAAMIVSLALLGHGVSGAALALAGERARRHFGALYVAAALAFAVAAPLCFALAQRLPFNGLALVWDPSQALHLAAIYLLLSLPFFFVASCFGLAFVARGERIPVLYAADLVGAGIGAAALIGLLYVLEPARCLWVVAALGVIAAAFGVCTWAPRGAASRGRVGRPGEVRVGTVVPTGRTCGADRESGPHPAAQRRPGRGIAATLLSAAALAMLLLPTAWLEPRINPYKGLSTALLVPGTEVVARRSGPLGLLHVVASPAVPLRHAPGLSLMATVEPPAQLGLFTDGDALSVITRRDDATALGYLGQSTAALPYALLGRARVLVLGAGGGTEVLRGLTLGAAVVVAVERDPNVVALVRDTFGGFAGGLYEDPRVALVVGDARSVLATQREQFDLIVLPLVDSASGAGGGVHAAGDAFLYTVDAVRTAWRRLTPDGVLAATRWEDTPPRDSIKLLATFAAALRAEGIAEPARHVAAIRGWQTSTLLLSRAPLDGARIARVAAFCERYGFDPAWYPGLDPADANRHHRVNTPWLHHAAEALLHGDAARFLAGYKFDVRPATDERPFFHDFFQWRTLPELWRLRREGAAALLDSGYLVMAATLAQAVPASLLLILLPLWWLRRRSRLHGDDAAMRGGPPALYFLCLGLGFLFVEISQLSRMHLFIGHPLLAATAVLAALLAFAGLGSALAARWQAHPAAVPRAAALVAVLVLLAELALPPLLVPAAGWPLPAKTVLAVLALAPLAIAMGLPFPLGLARLHRSAPALVPWAWGINGCASVLSALLAVLIAMELGYDVVMWLAAGLYAIAMLAWPTPHARTAPPQ